MQSSKFDGDISDITNGNDSFLDHQLTARGFRIGPSLAFFAKPGFGY